MYVSACCHICPQATVNVSSGYYICVLMLRYMSSGYYMCPQAVMCVLRLLYICPQAAIDVSPGCYICVLIQTNRRNASTEPPLAYVSIRKYTSAYVRRNLLSPLATTGEFSFYTKRGNASS